MDLFCTPDNRLSWSPICLSLSCFKVLLSQSLAQFFLFAGLPFYRFLLCKVTHHWNVFREQYLCVRCNWTHLTTCQQSGLVCLGFISPMMSCRLIVFSNSGLQWGHYSQTDQSYNPMSLRYRKMGVSYLLFTHSAYHNMALYKWSAVVGCQEWLGRTSELPSEWVLLSTVFHTSLHIMKCHDKYWWLLTHFLAHLGLRMVGSDAWLSVSLSIRLWRDQNSLVNNAMDINGLMAMSILSG